MTRHIPSVLHQERPTSRHLVTVWNPSYAEDAMEQHLAVLLERARKAAKGQLTLDDRYVWWGKVRSQHRLQAQSHTDDILAIGEAIEADVNDAGEVQLYLTDYRSLYVADVSEIVASLDAEEREAAPSYYFNTKLDCDFWFMLADIRLLVADDLPGVIAELRALHNVHYHDKSVSLYGGMVDLPLVVTRPDGQRFFDAAERDAVTEGRLWAEWDAEQGSGVAAMERELRDNLLGERAWRGLEATTRRFLATGEKLFREHRGDPAFDFGPVIGAFAKALEVQCRTVLRRALAKAARDARLVNLNGQTVDLLEQQTLTLGQLNHALATEQKLGAALTLALNDRGWFSGQLSPILAAFTEVRNPGVHEARVDRATATHWRDRLLGVGSDGVFVRLGGA
jgi:hypothetical protein